MARIKIHDHLVVRRNFGFSAGTSCSCEDKYTRKFMIGGTVTIEHTKCKYDKKHKSCPFKIVLHKKGDLIAVTNSPIEDPMTPQEFDDWLKEYGLIKDDVLISQSA